MIDKFLSKLYEAIGLEALTAEEIRYLLEEDDLDKRFRYVPLGAIFDMINTIKKDVKREKLAEQQREEWHRPYKKFMFVEDGSVDIEQLEEEMEAKHPEIKVVVYRQGAKRPELIEVAEDQTQ